MVAESNERMKILVACPNHEVKEYAFQAWIDNVKALTYPDIDIFVVDNSPTVDFMNRYKDQVPMVHIDLPQGEKEAGERISRSMEVIREHFLAGDYEYWMNIESDVIPPTNIIEFMLEHGKGADWVAHGYPGRGGDGYMQGIGCALFNRNIMQDNDFITGRIDLGGDGNFWEKISKQGLKYKSIEMYYFLDVKHLGTGLGMQ